MCGLEPNQGVDVIRDTADLERHASQSADSAPQIFVEAWAPIWLDEGPAFFGGAAPMVMQAVIGGAHGRRVPTRFPGTTSISSGLRGGESGTPAGVHEILLRRCPEVAAPNPPRPPATLWQPFGLTDPACENSRANLDGCPFKNVQIPEPTRKVSPQECSNS